MYGKNPLEYKGLTDTNSFLASNLASGMEIAKFDYCPAEVNGSNELVQSKMPDNHMFSCF